VDNRFTILAKPYGMGLAVKLTIFSPTKKGDIFH
jgi:hypothetical protein